MLNALLKSYGIITNFDTENKHTQLWKACFTRKEINIY